MRFLSQCCVFAGFATRVCSQEAMGEFPHEAFEKQAGIEPVGAEHHDPASPWLHRTSVSVQPAAAPVSSFLPPNVPPSGVILANGPGNVQSYQVPGVGMTLGAGKKIPFILINNVAASVSQEAAQIPSSEQAEMTRLCVNTMGPGFVYSPARHLCEPAAAAAAASVEEV
uniref:Uncharacterized protein n=1 Tax=Toxoplasma gondii COUG TaxID=1074873 RepID=A0A2G8Y9S0_TOXGO|nr:hypothetical protein TGCOUG_225953 [Toxoplasma gondii COUG]